MKVCYSDHYAGAELYYECLGLNATSDSSRYRINLIVYRDCGGVNYSPYYDVLYQSLSCGYSQSPLRLTGGVAEEITNLCPDDTSTCGNFASPIHGSERRIYSAEITLPHCTDWSFYWKNQNRNSAGLTNINGTGTLQFQPIFVRLNFNNSVYHCEDFFDFSAGNIMDQNICVGDTFVYDFKSAMNNPDGDSCYFTLVPPQTDGSGGSVTYEAGFSHLSPITTISGFNFNQLTGILEFAPSYLASSIFAVKVEEFKDGVKVAESIRDMQLITETCENKRPRFQVLQDTFYACVNQNLEIDIPGYDPDGDDYTITVLSENIPGNSIVTNQGDRIKIKWTPDTNHIGLYLIRLNINDNKCPVSLETTKTYYIHIPNDVNYQCICARADFEFDRGCTGVVTNFTGIAKLTIGTSVPTWIWDFGDGSPPASGQNVAHLYSQAGTYPVTVTFVDNLGCSRSLTKTVTICDAPQPFFRTDDSCQAPARVIFLDETDYTCPKRTAFWDFGDGTPAVNSNSHKYDDTGTFTVTMITTYADPEAQSACVLSVSRDIHINPKPEFDIFPESHYQSCDPSYDTLLYVVLADSTNHIEWGIQLGPVAPGHNGPFPTIPEEDGGNNDSLFINTEGLTLDQEKLKDVHYSATVTDSIGCWNARKVSIFDPIHVEYLNTPYCNPGDTIFFWDVTQLNVTNLHYDFLSRRWDFNDTSAINHLSGDSATFHIFPDSGYYNVDLTIFDTDSCYDWARVPEVRIWLPDNNFVVQSALGESDSICFFQHTLNFHGPNQLNSTIDRYVWYIDDAEIDSIEFFNTYSNVAPFWYYKVNGNLVPQFDPLQSHGGVMANAKYNNTIFKDNWFIHKYDPENYGDKHIELRITYNTIRDQSGAFVEELACERRYYDTMYVHPPHNIAVSYDQHCLKDTVTFTGVHDSISDPVVSWKWDFGDEAHSLVMDTIYTTNDSIVEISGSDTNSQTYKYTHYKFPDIGHRRLTISLEDVFGCSYVQSYDFQAIRMDTLSIRPEGHCNNDITLFPPASFDRWQNIDLYRWNFGDLSVSNDTAYIVVNDDSTLTYQYIEEGWHTVWLEIQGSGHTCKDTLTDSFFIEAAPTALFCPVDSTCLGDPTFFIDLSTANSIRNDTIVAWKFIISPGDTLRYAYPDVPPIIERTFTTAGMHDSIFLSVLSSNGCGDQYYGKAWVAKKPDADYLFTPALPVAGDNVSFSDNTNWFGEKIHADSSHNWMLWNQNGNMIDQLVEGGAYEYEYFFTEEGIYYLDLIALNAHYCSDTVRKEIDTYTSIDFPTAFSPDNNGNNENNNFRLYYKGILELLEYKIYNRYGELVFDGGTNLDAEWDGIWRGKKQEVGSYVVVVKAIDVLNREVHKKKNLLLIK